jgi:hypothetical protein
MLTVLFIAAAINWSDPLMVVQLYDEAEMICREQPDMPWPRFQRLTNACQMKEKYAAQLRKAGMCYRGGSAGYYWSPCQLTP